MKIQKNKKISKRGIKGEGRPHIDFDFDTLDNLLAIMCTAQECASVLGVSVDTIERKIYQKYKIRFAEYSEQKRGRGRASLRRRQFQMAETNPALCIWLGKQYLGQVDKQEIKADFNVQIVDDIE